MNHQDNTQPTTLLRSLFNIGDYVVVDETCKGYIQDICGDTMEDMKFTVDYTIDGVVETDISINRIKVTTIIESNTTRSGRIRQNSENTVNPPPPLPSTDSNQVTEPQNQETTDTAVPSNIPTTDYLYECIRGCFTWTKYKKNNKLYCYLIEGLEKECGWLRDIIQQKRVLQKTHLLQLEKQILTIVSGLFSGQRSDKSAMLEDHCRATRHAFGISRTQHKNIFRKNVDTTFTLKRKERKDKGTSVFNSSEKRRAVYTAFNAFKKMKYSEFREFTDKIPHNALREEFNNLPGDEKHAYDIIAERDLKRSEHLWDELKEILLKTKGKVSYATLSNHMKNIVCPNTIRNWLTKQDGFRIRKDRILPSLDRQAKQKRLKWSHDFWLFWYYVKFVKKEKAAFVLTHMDEKWFYAIRTRSNCKVLTSIGLEPSDYRAHHKSHIGKEMYVVVTAYILNDNDITKGGTAVPVSCVRVGKYTEATKNSYKRVYREDGSYHYPKIDANILRKTGQEYFQTYNLTGASEGTAKKPKNQKSLF